MGRIEQDGDYGVIDLYQAGGDIDIVQDSDMICLTPTQARQLHAALTELLKDLKDE